MMDRRNWLVGFLGLVFSPRALKGQPSARVFRIGILSGSSPDSPEASRVWGGFFQGLHELGYVEGKNINVESRFYGDNVERLPALTAELVRLQVDVIVVGASPAPEAARRATSTIPIVMTNHSDPVASGLVASLARPAGNVTGLSRLSPAFKGKQLQLLKDVVPGLSSVAVLINPTDPSHVLDLRALEEAAQALKLELHVLGARAPNEFGDAFSLATKKRSGALQVVGGNALFFAYRAQLVDLAAKSRLPAMYGVREFAEAGGLIAYAPNLRDSFYRAADYVDRILKGAKPGDLPIEQPTKFELVVNLKTAKALGIAIPGSVLASADDIIK